MMKEYFPKLDGLRAIAVGLVLVEHFAPGNFVNRFSPGGFGVKLFFTLSGFLITRILIEYRTSETPTSAARQFYWHRFLRLAPALYAAILGAALLGIANMRQDWWIHGLYLTNFKVFIDGHWGPATHFWSLAVEEQFYIIWFFVVVLLPRRILLPSIVIGLVSPIIYRVLLSLLGIDADFAFLQLPGCSDFLSLGALLGFVDKVHPQQFPILLKRMRGASVLIAALLVSGGATLAYAYGYADISATLARIGLLLLCAFLIAHGLSDNFNGLRSILAWNWIRHIGKISYGIYVYHMFVPPIIVEYLELDTQFGLSGKAGTAVAAAIEASATLLIAQLSWTAIERPIARFR
jgi:peptidoglycan/LPS O-acetylase OafA/YrhL